ncbi:hypothetical protein [Actinacidiphila alni]|uniref:hypothetical protein n=1 Tax=Actinacidiphila alni TaxID=380248 RepID=UPI0034543B08
MDQPPYAVPDSAPDSAVGARPHDPYAVALGNASLLGVGYLLLGRRGTAAVTFVVTVVLLSLLGSSRRSGRFELVVLLWWAAMTAHGWYLAHGWATRRRLPVRAQRLTALAVALPVLLAAGLLRLDASRIEHRVTDARLSGDCAKALDAQGDVWFGPRLADAPLTARGDRTVRACRRLAAAERQLATGLSGDTHALATGFDELAAVLKDLPGHQKMVDTALDGFLRGLPTKVPCDTATVTDWLRGRRPSHNGLDRSAAVVPRTAPAALVGCGDDLMSAKEWARARTRYQQQLDQYPDAGRALTAKSRGGVRQATLALELATVRDRLGTSTGTEPAYCSKPAKYSAAAPYRKGTNRALFYGDDEYTRALPASWQATDVTKAVLIVCVGAKDYGTTVATCPYENKLMPQFPQDVEFRRIAIPVKVYELRTGRLVTDTKIQIDGGSCPRRLEYTTYASIDIGPPDEVYVTPATSDIRAAFTPLTEH